MERKRIAVSLFALLMTVALTSFAGTITTGKSGYFSCAIAGNGPHCWGNNSLGALGTGSITPAQSAVPLPVAFSNATSVTSISAGDTFACALKDGGVYCWGTNNGAQLGLGTIDFQQPHPTPTLIPSLSSGVTEIAAGGAHACAIQNGLVKCWGQNVHGQIGNGALITALSPATVLNIQPGDAPRNLTAGYFHTCVVKGSTGALFCWGSGLQGELGNGGTADANVPSAVSNMQSGVSAVSAGNAHTCAVKFGNAYCWGKNNVGQLGIGTTSPFEVLPNAVAGNMAVASLSMGTFHSCLTNTAGALYCWGQNAFGALAHPTLPLSTTPIPIVLGRFTNVGDITANQNTTCAWAELLLAEEDRLQAYCWGMGQAGQLGNGSFQSTHVPQRVLNLSGTNQVPGGGETQ